MPKLWANVVVGVTMAEQNATLRRDGASLRLEQAARAAWLYYIAGRTQDEIAATLDISRQSAQRLVSLAVSEKLIKFRLDHPIAACVELEAALRDRYALRVCTVVPSAGSAPDAAQRAGLAIAGADLLARWFETRAPLVVALSTGATLRAVAAELSPQAAPQHKVMSLCGTMRVDGRMGSQEPVIEIAARTGAQCFPMPAPVIAATAEERQLFQAQRPFRTLTALLAESRHLLVGVGHIGWRCPMHLDGFVSDADLTELIEAGAVGEVAGAPFDADGRTLDTLVDARVNGLRLVGPAEPRTVVAVAGGPAKVAPLAAALRGKLLNGLITDEDAAVELLAKA